jgi:hypothetical protein
MNQTKMKKKTIRKSISGKFVPLEESDENEETVVASEFFEKAYRSQCRQCGCDVTSDSLSFDCPKCGFLFEDNEDFEKGFRLVKTDLEDFKDYTVSIAEKPHIYYKNNQEDVTKKHIIFSDTDEEGFHFIDKSGQFVVLDIDKINMLEEERLEEVIEDFKDRRRNLIDWKKLNTNDREFQNLVYRILDRHEDFEVDLSGAEGNEGGMDASVYYKGRLGKPIEVIVQCKRNTSKALSPSDITDIKDKIDINLDGSMILIACISVSGNVRKAQRRDKFLDENIHEVEIWQEEELMTELCEYPQLIREFFYGDK